MFEHIVSVILPLIVTGIMHMLVVKYNLFNSLKVPFSSRQFGQNKTWRGLLFVGLANGLFSLLLTYFLPWEIKNPFLLGMVLGIAYILFELPNSYLKRRIGIGPGEESKDNKLLHGLLDKLDSSFGVSLVYFLLGYGSFFVGVCLFFAGALVHIVISFVLVNTKVKKSF